MENTFKISLVIPCYNEEGNIKLLYETVTDFFQKYQDYEIIFIDDGSTDNTLKYIKELAQADNKTKYISFSRNFGHQNALKAGLDSASGDCTISMDADLQHPVTVIDEMIAKWRDGYEIVYTVRKQEQELSFFKRKTSAFFYNIMNLVGEINLPAGSADFRLIDKKVLQVLQNDINEYFLFLRGIIAWVGFSQCAIPYSPHKRHSGKTKYSVFKMFSLAMNGITSFSIKPLRLATLLGTLISLFAFVYALYAIGINLFTDKAVHGWTSVIISVLFIGGIQMLLLGILGEYLGKLFFEVKKRPQYIVREKNFRNPRE